MRLFYRLQPVRWNSPASPDDRYDRRAWCVIAALVALVLWTFQDYGISTDEIVQQTYGEKLWAFYLSGFGDRSVFDYKNLYLYGGFFDMVAVALQKLLPLEEFHVRHLLSGLIGVLGVAGTWRVARTLAGRRAGLLACALLALSASWYGAMFNNTKDIPFATGMVWLLHLTILIVARLPRPPLPQVIAWGVCLGLTLGLRVGGLFALCYLGAALLAHAGLIGARRGWRAGGREALLSARALLPALPVAYVLMGLFWPWSVLAPLNPIRAIGALSEFAYLTPLDGSMYRATDLPPTYLPIYLAIKLPELLIAGASAAIAAGVLTTLRWVRRPAAADGSGRVGSQDAGRVAQCGRPTQAALPWLPLVLSILMPLVYFLIARPALYNGMRHFFFVVPSLCVTAGVGLDWLWAQAQARRRWLGTAFVALLLTAAAREAWTMHTLHPDEYVYYNVLVGGPGGAFRRYEMDYWSNFMPEALDRLDQRLSAELHGKKLRRTYTVGVCTAPEIVDEYETPYLSHTDNWDQADFIISTTNGNCDTWARGRTIIEIVRDGAVLGVVKDRRAGATAQSGSPKAPAMPPIQ